MKRLAKVLAALLLLVAQSAVKGGAAEPPAVAIGVILPTSGSHAVSADYYVAGYNMAAQDINAAGGIKGLGGAKIRLIYGDSQSDSARSAQLAERMAEQDHVIAFTGSSTSTTAVAVQAVAEKSKIPFLIASGITDSLTSRGFTFTFRNHYNTTLAATGDFEFYDYVSKVTKKPFKRIALLWENSVYGTESSAVARTLAPKYGYEIVADVSFKSGTPDLTSQLLQVRNAHAQAIIAWDYATDAVVILKGMNTLGLHLPYIAAGVGTLDQSVVDLGQIAEGAFGIAQWNTDLSTPGTASLRDRFEQAYHRAPNDNTSSAYQALWILADALNETRSLDPVALRNELARIHIKKGPALINPSRNNEVVFDASGQSPSPQMLGIQLQHGKFVTVWPERFAKGHVEDPGFQTNY